jgi:hypothetical protein
VNAVRWWTVDTHVGDTRVYRDYPEKSRVMVTELQFVAVAAFLIWGLAASLCGLLKPDDDASVDLRHAEARDRVR